MRLIIDGFGKFVGVENGMIVVKEKKQVLRKIKAEELKQLIIAGKSAISSDALRLLAENGVDVVILSGNEIVGRLSHPLIGTVKTRREQYLAYYDSRGVFIAKEFVKAKLKNQSNFLLNLAKARRESNPTLAEKLVKAKEAIEEKIVALNSIDGNKIDDVRDEILGIEGVASEIYWNAIASIIPQEYLFYGRRGDYSPRFAHDIVNAMLNYGYAILHAECLKAVELAGLDPYAGFLHADRSGRTSISIDLMECFRQVVVDRSVLKLVTLSKVKPEDCRIENFVCMLKDEAKKKLISEVMEKLDTKTQYKGRNMSISAVILSQAREIASYLRGDGTYEAFTQKW
ncbi:MAG: CRISP-associated protein Cas1 [Archaeoglobaceae archaeon]|nr:CRISP-associated protein Cas1 [Archaeoglobaceae archaeon]MDK2876552.1 CRISP-associated protein Cas1 [Archaeoglobaceae archaeon]